MLMLPPHRFHGFEFMLDTFLAGAFMFAFLRDQRIGHFGSIVGGLSYQLSNGLLTAARQGALWKFDTACWVPLFLLFFVRILDDRPRRLRNSLFAGAALGLQFLGGEIQLAYYVCLLAFAYFMMHSLGRIWDSRHMGFAPESLRAIWSRLFRAALCVVVASAFAAEVLFSYVSFAQRQENVGVETDEDNWRFATEFSFSPRKTLSLALTGDISGAIEEPSLAGQQMTRLTDDYLGIVTLLFACIALLTGHKRAYFFACAAIIALMISFGKHFTPPYRLIYMLPAMKGLRNPHKWLFIMSVCIPILAGMGADYWKNAVNSHSRGIISVILIFSGMMIGCAFFSATVGEPLPGGTIGAIYRPLGSLIIASAACIVWRVMKRNGPGNAGIILPILVTAVLAGDLIANASKFILYYNYRDRYVNDGVAEWLRAQEEPSRVKVWSESPYVRQVATEVLPYYGIDVVDAIMSRRPQRYSEVFRKVREGGLPLGKFFQLFNVKYVLSATSIPNMEIPLSLVAAFEADSGRPSGRECFIYKFGDFLPRVYAVNKFMVADSEDIVRLLGAPDIDLREVVLLEQPPGPSFEVGEVRASCTVKNFSRSPHRVTMEVEIDRAAILVLQDFMDERWHAYVDGHEVEVLRANYLMRSIVVSAGVHEIEFAYKPPLWALALTLAGWVGLVVLVGAEGISSLLRQSMKKSANAI